MQLVILVACARAQSCFPKIAPVKPGKGTVCSQRGVLLFLRAQQVLQHATQASPVRAVGGASHGDMT